MTFRTLKFHLILLGLVVGLGLAGCSSPTPIPPVATATPAGDTVAVATLAPTAADPLPTAIPAAAVVNEQVIALADFEAAVARRRAAFEALGQPVPEEPLLQQQVLDQMVDEVLMVQSATQSGLVVTPEEVEAAYQAAITDQGSPEAFAEWLSFSQLTDEQFRTQLATELLIGRAAAQIADTVPTETQQVNARHILVADEATARDLLARIQAGEDFATLAVEFSLDQGSRINGGDLGWFPRGVLTVPQVEETAFGQVPGDISEPVQSFLGFHLVQTLQIEDNYPLSPEVRSVLQRNAVDSWLVNLRTQAVVERFVAQP